MGQKRSLSSKNLTKQKYCLEVFCKKSCKNLKGHSKLFFMKSYFPVNFTNLLEQLFNRIPVLGHL